MDAWAVVANGKPLAKIEKPAPEPVGTEILIEVTHCGVCHSDLHFWESHYDLGGGKRMMLSERGVTLPRTIGHETLGRIGAVDEVQHGHRTQVDADDRQVPKRPQHGDRRQAQPPAPTSSSPAGAA